MQGIQGFGFLVRTRAGGGRDQPGGLLGMYVKADQLQLLVQKLGRCERMNVGS